MKLQEIDWNNPAGASPVEVEYPDALIQEFMNWLRRTTAWKEDVSVVDRRLGALNRKLVEIKNAGGHKPSLAVNGVLAELLANPESRAKIEAELKRLRELEGKANRAAALKRARDAKAKKRAVA